MRGSEKETKGRQGLSIFYHRGSAEGKACPKDSDVRELISNNNICHMKQIMAHFGLVYDQRSRNKCVCCYVCIKIHSDSGCNDCQNFLATFLPSVVKKRISKTLLSELEEALFSILDEKYIQVETRLSIKTSKFVENFLESLDEVSSPQDIVRLWCIPHQIALKVYRTYEEIICTPLDSSCSSGTSGSPVASCDEEEEEENDSPDESDDDLCDQLDIMTILRS